jgi:hypothetical protein
MVNILTVLCNFVPHEEYLKYFVLFVVLVLECSGQTSALELTPELIAAN